MALDMLKECSCPKPVGECPRRGNCVACAAHHENHPRPTACMRPDIGPTSTEAMRHTMLQMFKSGWRMTKRSDLPPDDKIKI